MNVQEVYQHVECVDMNTEGKGICFIEDKKVFVSGLFFNEIADIEIVKVTSKYIIGKIVMLHKTHPTRSESLGRTYPKAVYGGCDLYWMSYDMQLEYKRRMIEKSLFLYNKGTQFNVADVIPSAQQTNYRNKVYYALTAVDDQIKACYFQPKSRVKETFDQDFLAHPIIAQNLPIILQILSEHHIPLTMEDSNQGVLKYVWFRYFEKTDQMMLVFVTSLKKVIGLHAAAKAIFEAVPSIKSIQQSVTTNKPGEILGNKMLNLSGQDLIEDQMLDLDFFVPAQAFYQVNAEQTSKLYHHVQSMLKNKQEAVLLDFYCGIGTMSLLFAKDVRRVIGVDIVKASIKAAKQNAMLNNIENVEFHIADVDKFMDDFKHTQDGELVAIVDPPRKGCSSEFLTKLITLQASTIIYISCNPQTLARDLQLLQAAGYKADSVTPIDMFPQTSHVETVVSLSKVK